MFKFKRYIHLVVMAVMIGVLFLSPFSTAGKSVSAQILDDPIPGLLAQMNVDKLHEYASALVAYGPRRADRYQSFIDDSCTPSGIDYPKSTIEMSSDYVRQAFLDMGYQDSQITMENVPNGEGSWGHNVYVTKIGAAYPSYFIEFGGHIDTQPGTPGGNDNASGAASVMELARVLKDYPNRYSMRFALWVAEEITVPPPGSYYHVQQALLRGEKIKAGLNIDSTGWPDAPDADGPNYMNEVWYNDTESERINDLFNTVRTDYGIDIGFRKTPATITSDERAYWFNGQTAVTSVGGWTTYHPNFHGCGDTVANIDFTNTIRAAQQNLAVGLKLDAEILPPTIALALSPDTIPANGSSTVIATATVTDASNHPLTTETVVFSTNGDVSISPVTNHGNGTYSVTITASMTSGDETITASDGTVSASAVLHESLYCPGLCFTDTLISDYSSGISTNTYLSSIIDGEVILQPELGTEFFGSTLPDGWTMNQYNDPGSGGTAIISNGFLEVDGARVLTDAIYSPGRTLEFVATFSGGMYQAAGLGVDFRDPPYAAFDTTNAVNGIYANTNATRTLISGDFFGEPHHYRIDWTNTGVTYYIDGNLVHTDAIEITANLRPILADHDVGSLKLQVDWLHLTPYASSGTYQSRVFDGGGPVNWGLVTWSATSPAGTNFSMFARSGNTSVPDASWTEFLPISNNTTIGAHARYLQYQVNLSTSELNQTPALREISIRYSPEEVGPPAKLGFIVQPAGAVVNTPFTTQPVIAIQDSSGYTIIGDNSTIVTLSVDSNPGGGILTCSSNPVTAVNGIASFSGCRLDKAGAGYSLRASAGVLDYAVSTSFTITAPQPASITLELSPTTVVANGTSPVLATVIVRDSNGNPLPGETVVVNSSGDVSVGLVTDNNGNYTATITASRSPGDEMITATVGQLSASSVLHETPYCPGTCHTNTTFNDFTAGETGDSTYVAETQNGEIILAPTMGSEFTGPDLPAGWPVQSYPAGHTPSFVFLNGKLSLDGAMILTDAFFSPGRVLEFMATFTGGQYQAVGLGANFVSPPWAAFDTTVNANGLYANTSGTTTLIFPSTSFNTQHHFRLEWTASGGMNYFMDGNPVATHNSSILTNMRIGLADYNLGNQILSIDWLRLSPYANSGTFTSKVLGNSQSVTWNSASWTAETPAGTSMAVDARTGDTAVPDGTWTEYAPLSNGANLNRNAKYLQYRVNLTTDNPDLTPTFKDICFSYIDNIPPTIINRSPAPGATNVPVTSSVAVEFSELMDPATITSSTFRLQALNSPSFVPATLVYTGTSATLTPTTALSANTQYNVLLDSSIKDLSGNLLGAVPAWSFSTQPAFVDTSIIDFNAPGSVFTGVYLADTHGGEVILQPTLGDEFFGSGPTPGIWSAFRYPGGCINSLPVVENGQISLNCWRLSSALFGPGHSLEFAATFVSGNPYQMAGFWDGGSNWRAFDLGQSGTTLQAASSGGGSFLIPGNPIGVPHRYRIDWTDTGFMYFVDGTEVGNVQTATTTQMPITLADYHYNVNEVNNLRVDWVRMSPYALSGTYTSRIFDAGQSVAWTDLMGTTTIPAGTALTFATQTSANGSTWSEWQAVNSPIASPNGRYLRYQAYFTTNNPNITPTLEDVTITYNITPTAVIIPSFTAQRQGDAIQLTWETASELDLVGFNLYRSLAGESQRSKLSLVPIAAQTPGSGEGNRYVYLDTTIATGVTYTYWLEVIGVHGTSILTPVTLGNHKVFIPMLTK